MADESKTQNTNTAKAEEKEKPEGRKVRLLAKSYMQPNGTKPETFTRFQQGAVLYVSDAEFELCNEFKPSFEDVDGVPD